MEGKPAKIWNQRKKKKIPELYYGTDKIEFGSYSKLDAAGNELNLSSNCVCLVCGPGQQ